MGKNENSVVVLQIRLKFWWMIPMGVKYNRTKFEQETQRWRPGTGLASGAFLGRFRDISWIQRAAKTSLTRRSQAAHEM